MWNSDQIGNARFEVRRSHSANRNPQSGYALVALLAVMTLMVLFAAAAAPSIMQQAQREREKEAIFRGEQVADAIVAYYRTHGNSGIRSLPTSMDQLLEGVPQGTKKRQILRASAAHDPLSSSGEWRLVGPGSQRMVDFAQSVITYAGAPLPNAGRLLPGVPVPQFTAMVNTGTSGSNSSVTDDADTSTGPFVGVRSSSNRKSVITYYGIDRHNEWVFTPLFR